LLNYNWRNIIGYCCNRSNSRCLLLLFDKKKIVKDIIIKVEDIEPNNTGNNKWNVTFCVSNLDSSMTINNGVFSIHNDIFKYVKVPPQKGYGGMLSMQRVIIEKNALNYFSEKIKPKTKTCFLVTAEAETGEYESHWQAYGTNLKEKTDTLKLSLKN